MREGERRLSSKIAPAEPAQKPAATPPEPDMAARLLAAANVVAGHREELSKIDGRLSAVREQASALVELSTALKAAQDGRSELLAAAQVAGKKPAAAAVQKADAAVEAAQAALRGRSGSDNEPAILARAVQMLNESREAAQSVLTDAERDFWFARDLHTAQINAARRVMHEVHAHAVAALGEAQRLPASFRAAFNRCLPLSDLPALEALQSSVTADAQAALSEADRIAQGPHRPPPLPYSGQWVGADGQLHTGPQPKKPQGPVVYQPGLVRSLTY